MQTQCNAEQLEFSCIERRRVVAAFDGGTVSSEAGALLLGRTDEAIGLIDRLAGCFIDERDPDLIGHAVRTLIGQRVFGMALGYEDLNDHESLRHDAVFGTLLGKLEPKRRSDCAALAGKSTLNRLELHEVQGSSRYHKIRPDGAAIERLWVDLFLEAHREIPSEIILDLDATDDPLHGHQEGRFFHGYYDGYCYLPLYIFVGEHLLCAKLRRANIDGAAGAREENAVDYVFGLAKNVRLVRSLGAELIEAKSESQATQRPARRFKELVYRTRKSWCRARRVVAKAEQTGDKANPRFIVTSLSINEWAARALYEDFYCARGECENRIKEAQLDLFADRLSAATFRANQLPLWLASAAYVLMHALRRVGLAGTALARACANTIRLRLLKIGAVVTVSVRRVNLAMSEACANQREFIAAFHNLGAAAR